MPTDDWVVTYRPERGSDEPSLQTWGDIANEAGVNTQTARDFARSASNAATFGMGDRLEALGRYHRGEDSDYTTALNRVTQKSGEAGERSPVASAAGGATGAALMPNLGGPALAARLGGGAAARALGYGAEGAAIGAAQGAGNTYTGNAQDYASNALVGGALGAGPGAVFGSAFAPRPLRSAAQAPTSAQLDAAAGRGYDALRQSPVGYDPLHFGMRGASTEGHLRNEGYVPEFSPGTWRGLERMQRGVGVPNAVVTPGDVDLVRKGLNRIPMSRASSVDRSSAGVLRERLDDFLANPPPGSVVRGTPVEIAEATRNARQARGDYAASKRAEALEDIRTSSEDAAASAASGLNRENTFRQKVKNFINPSAAGYEARTRGFTQDEINMLRNDIVRKGMLANTGRIAGNWMAGGGGVAGPMIAVAGGIGGGAASNALGADTGKGAMLGASIPLLGMGIRGMGNRAQARAMNEAIDRIAMRSPEGQARTAAAGMTPGPSMLSTANTARGRDALTLYLLRQSGAKPSADEEDR